ncbi:MAG: hypothetical protein M5E90_06450 [Asgard group archaeon]|nr:hypothetical protein [Asgard group archaeon]
MRERSRTCTTMMMKKKKKKKKKKKNYHHIINIEYSCVESPSLHFII